MPIEIIIFCTVALLYHQRLYLCVLMNIQLILTKSFEDCRTGKSRSQFTDVSKLNQVLFQFPPRSQFYHNQITFAIIIARAIITKWTQYAVTTHAMIIARAIITHVGTIQCSKIANGGGGLKKSRNLK